MNKYIFLGVASVSSLFGGAFASKTPSQAAVTPPPSPPECCMPPIPRYENNAFVMADFIYWVAKQEGNTYAATGNAITVPGTTDPNTGLIPGAITAKGKVYAPNPRIEPGFKVAVGMDFAYDQWDLFAEYTYLYSSAKSAVNSNNLNTGILPIFSYAPNNSILSQAT
jgi:hypothetical protein